MREIGRQRRLRRLGRHRPGRDGGDSRRRIRGGHPGAGGEHQASRTRGLSVSKAFFGSAFEKYAGA